MTKPIMNWFSLLLALTSTSCGIAFAANSPTLSFAKRGQSTFDASNRRQIPYGGAAATRTAAAGSKSTAVHAASQMGGSTEVTGNLKVCSVIDFR